MSEPPTVIFALPFAAVGLVVRSPVSVLIGSPGTLPVVDNTRCTLLTFFVAWLDCLTSVAASGSGLLEDLDDDEQPLIRAAAMLMAARTANSRRRVCIRCIVEGGCDCAGKAEVTRLSAALPNH